MPIYFSYSLQKIRVLRSFSETIGTNCFVVQNCHKNFAGEWQMRQLSFTCFFPKYGIQQSGFDRGKPNS